MSDTIVTYSNCPSDPAPKRSAAICWGNCALEREEYSQFSKTVKDMESELTQKLRDTRCQHSFLVREGLTEARRWIEFSLNPVAYMILQIQCGWRHLWWIKFL